jgi:hypothetical protein
VVVARRGKAIVVPFWNQKETVCGFEGRGFVAI